MSNFFSDPADLWTSTSQNVPPSMLSTSASHSQEQIPGYDDDLLDVLNTDHRHTRRPRIIYQPITPIRTKKSTPLRDSMPGNTNNTFGRPNTSHTPPN